MRYTEANARELEALGIAALAGAFYVVGNLDDAHLEELRKQNFAALRWQPDYRLIVISGRGGKSLLRFGLVDESEHFIQFRVPLKPPLHACVSLLRASVHDPRQFLLHNLTAPVRRVHKVTRGTKFVGLLIGDESKHYSSLLSLDGDRVVATDVEPRVAGGGGAEASVIEPVSEAEAEGVRSALEKAVTGSRIVPESPYTTHKQFLFVRPESA
jgi:hypothetical protein